MKETEEADKAEELKEPEEPKEDAVYDRKGPANAQSHIGANRGGVDPADLKRHRFL